MPEQFGSVAAGTITFNFAGTGSIAPPAGSYQGTQAIVSGTGELANLHGVLKQVGTAPGAAVGPLGTYSGQIPFGKPKRIPQAEERGLRGERPAVQADRASGLTTFGRLR